MADESTPKTPRGGVLDLIETIGNKLPDPATLFLMGTLLVMVVSWIAVAGDMSVQPMLPTPVVEAGEPVLGLLMLQGFDKKKKDWRGGTIYNPKNDKSYASRLKRLSDGRLQVKGCIGPVCQTEVWVEAPGALQTSAGAAH